MGNMRYRLLSESQLCDIHCAALQVLEETGVEVHHERALQILADSGCKVDFQAKLAYIPASLVEKSLANVPSEVELQSPNGANKVKLALGCVSFVPGTAAIELIDWQTRQARTPACADTADFVRVADALENIHFAGAFGTASDCPDGIWDRYRLYIMLKTSSKPVIAGAFTMGAVKDLAKLLQAVSGSKAQMVKAPSALICGCPSPPLKWTELVVEALLDCAENGLPFGVITMPAIGGTAPATIAGSLVQGHAEVLSALVISQSLRRGVGIVHGSSPVLFDAKYGTFRGGAIEAVMLGVGLVELGQYIGLPTLTFLGYSDAKLYDQQAAMESAMGLIMAAWAGANCIFGAGMLHSERTTDFIKLVVDNEVCGHALRLSRGVVVNDDTLAVAEFSKVRAERELFMSAEHTVRYYRSEVSMPTDVIDRLPISLWEKNARHDTVRRAAARLEKILTEHHPQALSEEAAKNLNGEMRAIMNAHSIESLPLGP